MTTALRCFVLSLAACTLACQAIAGIEQKRPNLIVDDQLCRDYCKLMDDKCPGEFRVYADQNQCLEACRKFPATQVGDSDNSIECRFDVANSISSEKADCAVAGPGGGGPGGTNVCGTNCENYCWLMSQSCAEPDYREFWLADLEECNAACQGLRDRTKDEGNRGSTSLYSAGDLDARDHWGDTVQCRLFHAVAASASPMAAATHCWHAALSPHARADIGSTNPCLAEQEQVVPNCKDYCRLVMVACTDDLKVYDSEDQCQAGCSAAFPPGNVRDDRPPEKATQKNSLGCRYTHAYNALVSAPTNAKLHCGHASPSGDGTCGSTCEAYCYQLFATCPNEAKDKRDIAQCETECKAQAGAASPPYSLQRAKSGSDPLACRLYALTEARASAGKADVLRSKCEVAAGKRACP